MSTYEEDDGELELGEPEDDDDLELDLDSFDDLEGE
jgi:hypothetical protein